jgi:hypothetical protein
MQADRASEREVPCVSIQGAIWAAIAIQRIAELEGEVRGLRRAKEILRTASAFFAAAELDRTLN